MNPARHCMLAVALACVGLLAGRRALAAEPAGAILDAGKLEHADGGQIYRHICQACHMPDARGARGAGQFPSLAGDSRLASSSYAIAVILMGRRDMPSFRPRPDLQGFEAMTHATLSDAEIARVVNYVRSHFGNHYSDRVDAADVAALRPDAKKSP
jgi:mono/diheme cytochrome c family protein